MYYVIYSLSPFRFAATVATMHLLSLGQVLHSSEYQFHRSMIRLPLKQKKKPIDICSDCEILSWPKQHGILILKIENSFLFLLMRLSSANKEKPSQGHP